MLDAIFSTSLIGPLEIAKWTFVALFVASTVGVIVGVYWEGDGFGKEKQHRGWLLLLRSLAAEIAFGVLIFLTDGWISEIQRHEIVALETRLAPRHLSSEQKDELASRMNKFSGTRFAISSAGAAEAENFALDVADALTRAGLQWVSWPLGGIATNPPGGLPQMGLDIMAGIETHIFADGKKSLAEELYRGLKDAGITSQWVTLPPPNSALADTVIVVVGSKE